MSEDEKVATLASISGNADLDFCRQLLEAHNNDLETAVNVAIGAVPAHGGRTQNVATAAPIRAVAPRPGPGIVHPNPLLALLVAPVKLGLGIVTGVLGIATRVVGGVLSAVLPPIVARRLRQLPHAVNADADDPIVAALEFRREFNAIANGVASASAGPDFLETGHREALRIAQTQLKFLFVYLHSRDHVDAHVFCQDVLADETFANFVNDKFVCWAGDLRRQDSHVLASAVHPSTFPYVALLQSVDGRTSLVMACEGSTTSEELMDLLERAAEAHSAPLTAARRARDDVQHARALRDEQDLAFQESLEADARREAAALEKTAKDTEAREQELRLQADEEAELQAAEQAQKEKEKVIETRRLEKAKSMRAEPRVDAEGVCKVAVKFPDGGRRERRFLESDTVSDVFDFLDSLEESAVGVAYSLVSNFPRRVFSRDNSVDLKQAGLAPQAMLMYRLDDDE